MKKFIIFLIVLILVLGIFGIYKKLFITDSPRLNMEVTSSAFKTNGQIPLRYTCDGENVNPSLKIMKIPEQAKSIALIVDDPDAPAKTWVHWIVFDIPVSGSELEIKEAQKPVGIEGTNDFGKMNYGGPCPPSGTHRYFFKAYALDKELGLNEGAAKKQVEKAMKGHILDSAELIGLYSKK